MGTYCRIMCLSIHALECIYIRPRYRLSLAIILIRFLCFPSKARDPVLYFTSSISPIIFMYFYDIVISFTLAFKNISFLLFLLKIEQLFCSRIRIIYWIKSIPGTYTHFIPLLLYIWHHLVIDHGRQLWTCLKYALATERKHLMFKREYRGITLDTHNLWEIYLSAIVGWESERLNYCNLSLQWNLQSYLIKV